MSGWLVAFLILQLFVLGVWFYRHLVLIRVLRNDPALPVDPLPGLTDPPLVSVIVPARNEETNIGHCLDSLLAQSYANREILIVDDRSEDTTAEVVRRCQEQHPEVRLIQVDELPPGWTGKTHALAQAADQAEGDWLLFVDADTRLHQHNLANAVGYARNHNLDILTLLARAECGTFWERTLQPLLGSMLMIRFPLAAVNAPRRRLAFANGQYILISRSCYDRLGGHEAVRGELLEDIALARQAREEGCALALLYGFRAARVRMYGTLREMWRGWRRIYIHAFGRSIPSLLLSAVLIVVFSLNPLALVAVAGGHLLLMGGGALWWWLFALGTAQVTAMISVTYRMYARLILADPRYLLFYPLAMVVGLGIFLDAVVALLVRRELVWRGTAYPHTSPAE